MIAIVLPRPGTKTDPRQELITTGPAQATRLSRFSPSETMMKRYNAGMSQPCPRSRIFCYVLLMLVLLWSQRALAEPAVSATSDVEAVARNLDAMLSVRGESCQLDRGRQRVLERALLRQAGEAARAVGYYQATIRIEFRVNGNCWKAVIHADAGDPVRVREVQVQILGDASEDEAFRTLIAETPLRPGMILRHDEYQSLRDRLLQTAQQRGYFDHVLTEHRLEVDVHNRVADVRLTLDSGRRYRFGEFRLQQDVLYDRMALRYLRFEQGDDWDSSRLLVSQQALLGSGYYTTARLERGEPDVDTLEVPATLHLSSRPKYAWLAGVGVSTDTGPRLRLGFENRYVNPLGHRWRVDSEVSPLRRAVSSSYEIPLKDPLRDRLVFTSSYQNEETDSAESEQIRLGASLISELFSGWVLTRSLDFERENFRVSDQRRTDELLMPGLQLQKIRGSHPIYPTRGWKVGVSVRGTHPSISTTEFFMQGRAWSKGILPVGYGRLLGRLELGQTAVDDVTTLPASVRFFAGGDTSVRGFDFQTLGPVDGNGDVIGGRSLITGSLEYDFPLWERWHPAAFVDAGNAFNDIEAFDARISAGAGIRWRSPLGPIRIDFARPVDDNRNWRLHLSMGPDL
jgi:translocation and assembly module TamA